MADHPPPSTDGVRLVAHGLPAVLGLTALIAAFGAWNKDLTPTLTVALLVIGLLLPGLAWLSLSRSRVGWSFLISSSGVLAVITAFGAPKVTALAGLPMVGALIIPIMLATTVVLLLLLEHEYKNS